MRGGAQLITSTLGRGNGGSVRIEADRVEVAGRNSGILSRVGETFREGVIRARGRGGDIHISAGSLSIRNGAEPSTSTLSQGNGGSVRIEADQVEAADGNIFSSAGGLMNADTGEVIRARGDGGDIRIVTDSLSVRESSQLVASTFGSGNAGSVIINARDRVEFNDGYAYSRAGGTRNGQLIPASGRGGELRIVTGSLWVQNSAKLSAESLGNSEAGNIILNANAVHLDGGNISTETRSSNGGNITLQNADLLLLVHNSRISTSAGLAQAGGNGGNITLNANLIAASANDNNDITANAFNGRGGAVSITRQLAGIRLLSRDELQTRLGTTNPQNLDSSRLPSNDITAISQNAPTLNGQVTVNPPNVDPSRGLTELPTAPIDATHRIASTCPTNIQEADRLGSFIVSGRGGLPPSPTDLLNNDNTLTEWVTAGESGHVKAEVAPPNPTQAIVEAQGWVVDSQGNIKLVAQSGSQAIAPTPCPQR